MQHERKPLLDKKETVTNTNSGGNVIGEAHNTFGSAINSTNATNVKPFSSNNINNLSTMFPVGLSFAELTSTLAQRGSKLNM